MLKMRLYSDLEEKYTPCYLLDRVESLNLDSLYIKIENRLRSISDTPTTVPIAGVNIIDHSEEDGCMCYRGGITLFVDEKEPSIIVTMVINACRRLGISLRIEYRDEYDVTFTQNIIW